MTQPRLHSPPRLQSVLLEQIRTVGLAFRLPAAVATALLGLATLLLTVELLTGGGAIDFRPEQQGVLPGLLGLLVPIGVWKGQERFGPGFLWTLPVERRRHAQVRVFAGWVWLMAAVLLFVAWLLGLALLSGGNVLAQETLRLVPSTFSPAPGTTLEPGAVETVLWEPEPLLWLVPFTSATGTYLLASALALGTRYPLRWIVGTVLGFLLLAAVAEAADVRLQGLSHLLQSLLFGPYGVDALLSARTESLKALATLSSTGERVVVWRGLPDPARWAAATVLWTGAGLAALWAAASRHRERRSA